MARALRDFCGCGWLQLSLEERETEKRSDEPIEPRAPRSTVTVEQILEPWNGLLWGCPKSFC